MAMLRLSLVLVLTATLSACGFQVRGSERPLHKTFPSVQVQTSGNDNAFYEAVDQVLRSSRIKRNDTSANKLEILSSNTQKRTASYSSRAKSAEFELIKTVSFRFTRDDEEIIAPMKLETRRSYLYRETAAVGKAEEENLLRQEMDSDLAQRILLALQRAAETWHEPAAAADTTP